MEAAVTRVETRRLSTSPRPRTADTFVVSDNYQHFRDELENVDDTDDIDARAFHNAQHNHFSESLRDAIECHKQALERLGGFWSESHPDHSLPPGIVQWHMPRVDIELELPSPRRYEASFDEPDDGEQWLTRRPFYEKFASDVVIDDGRCVDDRDCSVPQRPQCFYRDETMRNVDIGALPEADLLGADYDDAQFSGGRRGTLADPEWVPDHVRNMWTGVDGEPKTKRHRQRSAAKTGPQPPLTTKVVPFEATLRGEVWQRTKKKRLDELKERLSDERRRDLATDHFRAQPVPAHVKVNLYGIMCRARSRRQAALTSKRRFLLRQQEKPFSFWDRDQQYVQHRLQLREEVSIPVFASDAISSSLTTVGCCP